MSQPLSATRRNRTGPALLLALAVWLLAAIALGASGALYRAPAPVIGGTAFSLVALVLLATYFVGPLRAWAMHEPLRTFILYHTVRFVGVLFLVLVARGVLPEPFIAAGWGDIAVAAAAIPVAFLATPVTRWGHWWAVLAWNVLGLIDILLVIATGMRLGLADIDQMAAMTAFPLSLLPTFIVPLIIATHVLIFVRLARLRAALRG